jgi:hypothetical protein
LKLLTWSVIRTRAVKSPKQLTGGLFNNKREIATFIALGNWKEDNGIFAVQRWSEAGEPLDNCEDSEDKPLVYIGLQSGEDISVSGADTLFFSGQPGGLAIILRLGLRETSELP